MSYINASDTKRKGYIIQFYDNDFSDAAQFFTARSGACSHLHLLSICIPHTIIRLHHLQLAPRPKNSQRGL